MLPTHAADAGDPARDGGPQRPAPPLRRVQGRGRLRRAGDGEVHAPGGRPAARGRARGPRTRSARAPPATPSTWTMPCARASTSSPRSWSGPCPTSSRSSGPREKAGPPGRRHPEPARAGRLRHLHRQVPRRAPHGPSHRLPHGPHQLRQDPRCPGEARGGRRRAPTWPRCGSWRWRTTRPCATAASTPAWSPARRSSATRAPPMSRAPSRPRICSTRSTWRSSTRSQMISDPRPRLGLDPGALRRPGQDPDRHRLRRCAADVRRAAEAARREPARWSPSSARRRSCCSTSRCRSRR